LAVGAIHRETKKRLRLQQMRKRGAHIKGGASVQDVVATDGHAYAQSLEGDHHVQDWTGHVHADDYREDKKHGHGLAGHVSHALHEVEQMQEHMVERHSADSTHASKHTSHAHLPHMPHMHHHETAEEKHARLKAETAALMVSNAQMHAKVDADHSIIHKRWRLGVQHAKMLARDSAYQGMTDEQRGAFWRAQEAKVEAAKAEAAKRRAASATSKSAGATTGYSSKEAGGQMVPAQQSGESVALDVVTQQSAETRPVELQREPTALEKIISGVVSGRLFLDALKSNTEPADRPSVQV